MAFYQIPNSFAAPGFDPVKVQCIKQDRILLHTFVTCVKKGQLCVIYKPQTAVGNQQSKSMFSEKILQ